MTTFDVTTDTGTEESVPEAPVPKRSPLLSLKERREELQSKLFIDLPVPRWGEDIEIVVRYGPVKNEVVDKSLEQRQRQMPRGWSIWTNADVLVDSCIEIYAIVDNDGVRRSLRVGEEFGPFTRFDPALGENLGLSPVIATTAAHICRALYQTDGDLLMAANALFAWSGESTEKLDEDFIKP
jgi:hypothetical protein